MSGNNALIQSEFTVFRLVMKGFMMLRKVDSELLQ